MAYQFEANPYLNNLNVPAELTNDAIRSVIQESNSYVGIQQQNTPPDIILFNSEGTYKEILKICQDGNVYWRGKLVTNSQALVNGLFDVLQQNRCPRCKESRTV